MKRSSRALFTAEVGRKTCFWKTTGGSLIFGCSAPGDCIRQWLTTPGRKLHSRCCAQQLALTRARIGASPRTPACGFAAASCPQSRRTRDRWQRRSAFARWLFGSTALAMSLPRSTGVRRPQASCLKSRKSRCLTCRRRASAHSKKRCRWTILSPALLTSRTSIFLSPSRSSVLRWKTCTVRCFAQCLPCYMSASAARSSCATA
mmetsp:Transcript_4432/g.12109  ORF Transcript_4432/g.12109 Transcript_4432/m.12109 type:complete len:204 (-) Transcript_4432:239-850(-)